MGKDSKKRSIEEVVKNMDLGIILRNSDKFVSKYYRGEVQKDDSCSRRFYRKEAGYISR